MKTILLIALLAAIILIGVLAKKRKLTTSPRRFYAGDRCETFDLHGCRVQANVISSTEEDAWIEFLDSRGSWNARKTPHAELMEVKYHVNTSVN